MSCEEHTFLCVQVMVTNVTSLLKTVKAVEDEHTRGTRALESTIEAIAQEIRVSEPFSYHAEWYFNFYLVPLWSMKFIQRKRKLRTSQKTYHILIMKTS
jgi:hypothetical protein